MNFKEPCLAAPLLPSELESNDDNVFAAMSKLRYPVYATLKVDGVRGLRLNSTLLSRRLKKIPNRALREYSTILPGGIDCELFQREMDYNEIQGIVMSHEHTLTDRINFHILDLISENPGPSYLQRIQEIIRIMPDMPKDRVKFSPPVICANANELFSFEQLVIQECGEGICFRLGNSPYKQGRSTLKEQYLVKLSRFQNGEAVIIGFKEQMFNAAPEHRNKTGHMDKSREQMYQVGKNTLGAFMCKDGEHEFDIGTGQGLDDKLRKHIWEHKEDYLNKTLSYRAKSHGKKVKPRQPTYRGMRDITID